jgi:uncharacterized membrane protein
MPTSTGTAKWLTLWTALMVLGNCVYAWSTFDALPARIPMHFDATGVANGFAPKSWAAWLLLPGIATGISVLFTVISLSLRVLPAERLNLPNKQRFLALPPERRRELMVGFGNAFLTAGALWVAFFWTVERAIFRVATGVLPRFNPVPAFLWAGLIVLVLLGGTLRFSVRLRDEPS